MAKRGSSASKEDLKTPSKVQTRRLPGPYRRAISEYLLLLASISLPCLERISLLLGETRATYSKYFNAHLLT